MVKIKCPCCENYTIEDDGLDPLIDICPVCFWQYDWVSQKYPDKNIGPNRVSLVEAQKNYREFGAVSKDKIEYCRKPFKTEKGVTE